MTGNETRVEPTKERLRKPGAEATYEEINLGVDCGDRIVVRVVTTDTLHGLMRPRHAHKRLSKPQDEAATKILYMRAGIKNPLSVSRYERSGHGSGEESQRAAECLADWNRFLNSNEMRGTHARVIVWLIVEGINLEMIGWRDRPGIEQRRGREKRGRTVILAALDAAAKYFGYESAR